MSNDGSVTLWIDQLKQGDAEAAERLWHTYYRRLVGFARKKLQDAPRSVSDEEDVVQSAFKSFCLRAQNNQFPDLRDRDNLWPLLVIVTARKAANQRLHARRAKRGGGRVKNDSAFDEEQAADFAQAISTEPSPDEAAQFLIELDKIMDRLDDPKQRVILLWKLEERTNAEIARLLDCSVSAVERKLRLIREGLESELTPKH
jgi:RNA polymerase sigma factor (sigma-70 family)